MYDRLIGPCFKTGQSKRRLPTHARQSYERINRASNGHDICTFISTIQLHSKAVRTHGYTQQIGTI